MIVEELIEALKEMNPGSEVRLAHQPSWPFEYSIDNVISVPTKDEDEDDEDDNEFPHKESEIVYIGEGSQLGYLPEKAKNELGW